MSEEKRKRKMANVPLYRQLAADLQWLNGWAVSEEKWYQEFREALRKIRRRKSVRRSTR